MKKSVILDVDTGIDDALAIALGTYTRNLNIKLITTIAGNLSVTEVTKNTLNFLQAIEKRRIPVATGASGPMERERQLNSSTRQKRIRQIQVP